MPHHSHNLGGLVSGTKIERLADWVLSWEHAVRETFVNYRYGRSRRIILFRKTAPANQRNPHGFEVAGSDDIALRERPRRELIGLQFFVGPNRDFAVELER